MADLSGERKKAPLSFTDIPLELRQQIWQLALEPCLPGPTLFPMEEKAINRHGKGSPDTALINHIKRRPNGAAAIVPLQSRNRHYANGDGPPVRSGGSDIGRGASAVAVVWQRVLVAPDITRRALNIAGVNREALGVVDKWKVDSLKERDGSWYLNFDPRRDIFYLRPGYRSQPGTTGHAKIPYTRFAVSEAFIRNMRIGANGPELYRLFTRYDAKEIFVILDAPKELDDWPEGDEAKPYPQWQVQIPESGPVYQYSPRDGHRTCRRLTRAHAKLLIRTRHALGERKPVYKSQWPEYAIYFVSVIPRSGRRSSQKAMPDGVAGPSLSPRRYSGWSPSETSNSGALEIAPCSRL